MQPWQRNVLIDKYIADSKVYQLNEMIESDKFTEEQKQLFEIQIQNLEKYIESCTKLLSDVDPNDILEVYKDWNGRDPFEDKKTPYKLSRKDVTQQVYDYCMEEMFRKSQPAGSYYEYVEKAQNGEITEKDRIYEWHYLSQDEYQYIIDKYINAYNIGEKWHGYVDVVKQYFEDDVPKDKWIPEYIDKDGDRHPGHRGYEHLPHFSKVIEDIINEKGVKNKEDIDVIAQAIYDAVIERITACQNFYKFDREESGFRCSIALGPSPSCNKEAVIKYWKDKGVELNIEDRDPNLFWEKDEYGEDYEPDEYIDNPVYNEDEDEETDSINKDDNNEI